MKKHLTFFILLILFLLKGVFSQPYGNEWINFSQRYYKIKLAEDGIYRISFSALASSGIDVSGFDPRQFQIFHKGIEQYIYVHGENDGVFDASDYIEFYGMRNNGTLDSLLYVNPHDLPNYDYSLINDTAAYFLTWNSSINNRRLQIENDKNFSGYVPENYVWFNSRINYANGYFSGQTDAYGNTDPRYTSCEGWFERPPFNGVSPSDYVKSIPTPVVYSEGPSATINMLLVGASNAAVSPDHHIVMDFAGFSIDTVFEGYKQVKINKTCAASALSSGLTSFKFHLPADLGATADNIALSYIDIRYPRQTNLKSSNFLQFEISDPVAAKAFFNFTELDASATDSLIVYDITNKKRILTSRDGNSVKFLIPKGGGLKKCYLFADSKVNNVGNLFPVNVDGNPGYFTNYSSPEYKNIDYLLVTHKTLRDVAFQYANYRKETGYNPVVVTASSLYEQFYYGVELHPLAITNFARYAKDNFADTIHGLFLFGKSYRAGETNENYRKNSYFYNLTYVPSIGNPPSDQMFTSKYRDNDFAPDIPTGRLAARNATEAMWYFNKIKDFEAEHNKPFDITKPFDGAWKKKVLHFAGGDTQYLMQLLLGYLNKYKDTLSSIHYGADVTTFTKSSTAVIQQNQSDYLRTLVNNGVSMMNFFGHAAGIGFDISIDNPEDYSNYKRYYFILANSCFAGDLFESAINSSEAFVLINNKGAIGFLGAVKSSSITSLHKYSSELIGRIAKRNYNKPIGYIIKKTIETLQSSASDDLRSLCFGMTLHGDPVLKLSVAEKPDFMLTQECISFTPSDISSELDSFAVNIAVYNLGKSIQDSVVLELTRTFPDNTEEKYIKLIPSPEYCDTITFRLPLNSTSGAGMNTFHAFIDAYAMVDESEENNNTTTTNLFISSNEVNPIYPYEYQVLPDTFITLIASSGYAMAPVSNYIFQIDTTDAFNSPFLKQSNPISKTGGIIEWSLPFTMLDMPDSTVYYWRVRSEKSENWGESSFQFIKGKRGWGQAHFFQFKKDKYNYVSYNKPARKFEFINIYQNISAQTGIMPYIQWEEEWYKINNIIFGQTSCAGMTNAIKFAVFDTIGVSPWENFDPDGDNFGTFGSLKCKPYPLFYFDFITNNEPWFSRIESLIDSVPNGYYVLAFSHLNHNAENYPESLYQAFESIGSNVIRTLPNNVPYIIFGRKGHYNMADERVGNSVSQIISGSWDIKTNWREGYIESTQIGPASSWGSLHWRVKSYEQGVWTDSVRLSVIGIKHNGTEDTVIRNLPPIPDSLDIYNLFSRIDASVYPYLRLHLKMSDDSLRTPAQLERWQVLYEPVPETAIDPSAYFSFYNANLKEGETARIAIATRNIGPVDFPDSLMVSYMLVDDNKKVHNLKTKKTRLHPVKDILIDSISFSTRGFAGNNSLWVEFNPINSKTGQYDQLEQYHFNNIAEIRFFVEKDRINPMLDVTFDGVHILDGDIVSASPLIEILLKDENKFLMLDDTADFKVFIKKEKDITPKRIYFMNGGKEIMRFYKANSSSNNSARIEYNAGRFSDGKYLLIVQARDISGNESGDVDYKINFEVINKPAITDVLNWPNPFSTRTHFVFTLTGNEVPEYFKIQIMTISGKVVKEIDKSELGNIHIGRNITEYAWDGRDEFGDLLANGVYLYRVIVKLNGEKMNKIETPAGNYFTKEFGKMVLIR